jgi:hypothetical protein
VNSEGRFIIRKVWELVQLCSDQRRRCRWVNLADFRDALDSWEIGRKEAYAALRELERRNYLLTMTRGDDDTITDIVITPERFRCNHCRLVRGHIARTNIFRVQPEDRYRSLRSAPGRQGPPRHLAPGSAAST